MAVEKGNTVKLDYEGKLDDGTMFDSSAAHDQPLEFKVGAGQVIAGFDNAVMQMEVGDEKEFVLPPEEAYGLHDKKLVQKVPRKGLALDDDVKQGVQLMIRLHTGQQIVATVADIDEMSVTLDLNHALAGQTLHFKIKVLEII